MEFLRFELARRLRQPMVYIFFIVEFLLVFAALNLENVVLGAELPNVNVNAPWTVQKMVLTMTLVGLLATTAFMNTAALRDFISKFDGILFTKPVSKLQYLGGRFIGATIAACIPLLGVLLAVLVSGLDLPGGLKVGAIIPAAYLWSIVLFIVPNTLFIGSLTFGLAVLSRSQVVAFVGALAILMASLISGSLVGNLDSQWLATLLDPFGTSAFENATKYWTAVERNTEFVTLANSAVAINRMVWLVFSGLMLSFVYWKFDFAASASKRAPAKPSLDADAITLVPEPIQSDRTRLSAFSILSTFASRELKSIVSGTPFRVIVLFAIFNMVGAILGVDQWYGTGNHPATYLMVEAIRNSLHAFLGAIVMYYAGVLVWRERDAHMAEIIDATSCPGWIAPISKFLALAAMSLLVLLVAVVVGIAVQASKGYFTFDLATYVHQLLIFDWMKFLAYAGLALFVQAVCNNKYLGYFTFLIIVAGAALGMNGIGVESHLFIFAGMPTATISAFNGLQPFAAGQIAFGGYWLLFTALLMIATSLLWIRGRSHSKKDRMEIISQRFSGGTKLWSLGLLGGLIALGGFIFYNTSIQNEIIGNDEVQDLQEQYEINYSRFSETPQPRITRLDFNLDLYPGERKVLAKADLTLTNKNSVPVDTLLLVTSSDFDFSFEVPNAKLVIADSVLDVFVYAFAKPLLPGASIVVKSAARFAERGIENEVSQLSIVQNGTFLHSREITPHIGYNRGIELADEDERAARELVKKDHMAKLHADGSTVCNHHYLGDDSDWVTVHSTITTAADQIAIAPGDLVSQRTDESTGRITYEYDVPTPVLNFYSFVSGRYEVERQTVDSINLEVYFLPEHRYNVDKMLASMRTSIDYYTKNFGAYPHQQARIIEFPRYKKFAQAFPGTMPYSEAMGFLAKLDDTTDIDFVHFVVAHEMAHQWWGHQVVGAKVQGATMLSETFAQYGALMVGKATYGDAYMRKMLRYEMDRYLSVRGRTSAPERPLLYNENQQFIHYQKGSVIMYALQDYIGEDTLNVALRNFRDAYAYQDAPYPTSLDFLTSLRPQVPDSLSYLINDWFEDIVLYDNRVLSATVSTLDESTYEVNLTVQVGKFSADSLGTETPLSINGDYIDLGIYGTSSDSDLLGEALWVERVKFESAGERSFSIRVSELPSLVAIDGKSLLIDRNMDDNSLILTLSH
ncbi:MAG: ABC transporter permease/M1 family aminopeptidase [Saprospiraceae bacterium]